MSFQWAPEQYAQFADHRQRAALDLFVRVQHDDPGRIHDMGCGRGEMARLMAKRWPNADVIGSDLSPQMLEEAKREITRVRWLQLDISTWEPEEPFDVLFANAVFHWLPDHASLLPRLIAALAPGGVLAFQMPLSWPEPINAIARQLVAGNTAVSARLHKELPPVEWYYDLLAPVTRQLDIWETCYLQVLTGDDPVLEWAKGAALRPVLETLGRAELTEFLVTYKARLRGAYPRRPDGSTLLPFPRRFVVAST